MISMSWNPVALPHIALPKVSGKPCSDEIQGTLCGEYETDRNVVGKERFAMPEL